MHPIVGIPACEMLAARYVLVDEGELVRSGKLPTENLAALLFRLEHNRGIAGMQQLLQTIWNSTEGTRYVELRRAIASWRRYVLLPHALPQIALPAALQQRIQTATPAQLETWSLNILDTETLEDVFTV